MIFKQKVSAELLNSKSVNMIKHLGIEITDIGENYLCGKMPVDERTKQPMGLLHGGASVVLAETLGSLAAQLTVDPKEFFCVGLEINANHIKSAKDGFVYAKAEPIHIGKKTQVWQTCIKNNAEELICISRLTVSVIPHKK